MPNPVAVADLVARWRPLSTAETALGQLLLDDAWALLLYKIPDLEARLAVVGEIRSWTPWSPRLRWPWCAG